MNNRVRRLTRSVINRICDAVLPVPSLDSMASDMFTSILRERMRDQLAEIDMVQTEEAIEMLITYMVNRQRLAFIKDDTNVGLTASEAANAGVAQTAMSAFKATSHDVSLATIVSQMSSSLSTVVDRSDQKVIVHFNPEYAPGGRNYSLQEVADMRSVFVRTTLSDIIFSDRIVIGVLKAFDGDGLDAAANRAKANFQEDSFCQYLEPGNWNRARAMKTDGSGIVCMRLYLDSQLAYSRGISMNLIIRSLIDLTADLNCSVTGSTLQDGIVDILSRDTGKNLLYVVSTLERAKQSFGGIELGGIPTVNSMALERVDIKSLFLSSKKASQYYVAQLGMEQLLYDNNQEKILTWKNLDTESYLLSSTELDGLDPSLYLHIGNIGDSACVYFPDYGGTRATPDQLTELYIAYYCSVIGVKSLKNIWVLRLDSIAMKIKCIDLYMVEDLLHYCGLVPLSIESSRTSELVEYIYLFSEENPKEVIDRHFEPKSYYDEGSDYTTTKLSVTAKSRVEELVGNVSQDVRTTILKNIETGLLDRMSKYYYAVLSVARKKTSNKEGGPIIEHVASHTYVEVLRFPFVSREKTTCNDWFTMNFTIGADAAKNNYILEPVQLFQGCEIKIDPRHLDLISDYVYERGEPSGMGLVGMKKHGIGFTHEMSTQNTYSQLYSGHTRAPEMAESYSISTYMGTPPIGIGTKEREVEQARRIEEMDRSKISLRRGREKLVVPITNAPAQNSDAVDIAIRSMFIDTDPYFSVPTFELSNVRVPKDPGELEVSGRFSEKIMAEVRDKTVIDTIVGQLELLREYVGHIRVIPQMDIKSNILDVDALHAYFTEHSSFFS